MTMIYFETDKLKDLSNKELIEKQQEISNKCSLAQKKYISSDIIQQLIQLDEAYTAEIDRRYREGLIDEDELEDEYEDFI